MIYKEEQKFRQPAIWVALIFSGILIIGIFGAGIYLQIIKGQQFGNNPMSDNGLIVTFILVIILFLIVILLFGFANLKTVITKGGIEYKFLPFHLKFHKINWGEIEKYDVITYNPIRDYGGWGIKTGKNSKAFNVSGNWGLLLELKSGNRILIGTQNEVELKRFLGKLFKTVPL